jgi:tetraacyldisaccharide 4'-kinase
VVNSPQLFDGRLKGGALHREGCAPVFTRAFADHHNYTQSELHTMVKEAKARGAEALITTAKDAIKLADLRLELLCYVLEIQISIDDKDRLIELIQAACPNQEG